MPYNRKQENNLWSKRELQVYILLLCANADKEETKEELAMIQAKVSPKMYTKLYLEFKNDSEELQLLKIKEAVHDHQYSHLELSAFRKDVYKVFFSDGNYTMLEQRLDWTLDNILY